MISFLTKFVRDLPDLPQYVGIHIHSEVHEEEVRFENIVPQALDPEQLKRAVIEEDIKERAQYLEQDDSTEDEGIASETQSVSAVPEYNTEDLFCDVYYQCTHLVGKDASEGFKKDALLSYLKNVFEFDDAKCKSLIDGMKNKQVPKMVLKVDVIEAKELTPKDANGLSDPYCTLWISSSQTNRFTTSVKKETLQPVWEENFKLPVASPTQDVLHFEVWDFDAAESLKEKVTKISDVKGFRGIKKFVKEFAQTVASGNHDNELIGSAQITLKNIPANGQMAWFKLQKRGKGAGKGMILLKMIFGSEKDEVVALEEHRYLVKTLLQHQMKQEGFEPTTWDGVFCPEGEIILRQHLAQCNLGLTDDLIAKWVEYVNIHQNKQINFGVLANLSSLLVKSMKDQLLTDTEVKHFWNAARKVLPSCYNNIRKIRKSTPSDKAVLAQLDAILSIIQDLTSCSVPSDFNLFPPESYAWVATIDNLTVKSVLHEAVVHGACDWFEYLVNHNRPESNTEDAQLKYLVKVAQLIGLDLDGARKFHEMLFKERLNFPYAKTLFAVYQSNVAELVEGIVTDMCMMMKPLDFEKRNDKDANNDPLSMGTTMFELFLALQAIERTGATLFDNDDVFETFPLRKFYSWFFPGVVRWLDIAAFKALQRIDKAVELDDFMPVDSTVQYSSSAIDTMGIFQQVKTFWEQLAWPDIEGSYTFMAKIIDDICKSSIHYADRVAAKVDGMGETQTAYEKKFEVTSEWCVAINNIDYIHHSIHPFVKGLGLDKLLNSLSDFKSTASAEHCRQTLELVMSNAVENVGHKISELSETLTTKMEPSMTRFLQEGAELLHQQTNVIDRLMSYLDENLTTLNSKLNADNFNRFLDVIWERISNVLFAMVQNGIDKRRPPSYFHNLQETLHILIGFFKIDEKNNQEEENKKLNDILGKVERILTIYGMETPELIHQYYMERLDEQTKLEKSEDGMMTVQLQLDQDKLIVDVLNASNLRSMDSNGSSDPFVSIRLIPKHKFPTHKYKTKVHKKTLFPLFEEKFTITLANDQAKIKDALVMFVMKDQDLFGATNDYMAEAFVPLNDVDKVEPNKYPKMRNLKLNRPKNTESDILKALDYRSGDKLARDFVKKQKSRMEVPH
ncbi:protein unc-13 homolog 4B-like isoform X2 [Planococcus citri]|uniref:protein unc-13 homolog 4B-like isoform X2 n=1 Tax=Planococcus citri TaxID=170843 RepID=UPI0031F7FA31